jgi:hypothetical protein
MRNEMERNKSSLSKGHEGHGKEKKRAPTVKVFSVGY